MREFVTEAIVLDREPIGEYDSRVHLFTKHFGKLIGRATSARKITSKLSAHLEPGTYSRVRLVEQKGLRVTDALKARKIGATLHDLAALGKLLEEGETDEALWAALSAESWSWPPALRALGWDPKDARCTACDAHGEAFSIRFHEFFCGDHASKLPSGEVIYIART